LKRAAFGFKVKRAFHIPFQIQIHTDLFSPYFKKGSVLNSIRVRQAKKILPHADEIRVVSERIKYSLIQHLKIPEEKIDVLPIYVDRRQITSEASDYLAKKYPEFSFFIVMVSRLTREKNIGFALSVFHEVVRKYPTSALIIVGSGRDEEKLKKKAQQLHIGRHVKFELWQPNLNDYYQSAKYFC
jgi:glycosyltransferase involved in cell wall biosynthesis